MHLKENLPLHAILLGNQEQKERNGIKHFQQEETTSTSLSGISQYRLQQRPSLILLNRVHLQMPSLVSNFRGHLLLFSFVIYRTNVRQYCTSGDKKRKGLALQVFSQMTSQTSQVQMPWSGGSQRALCSCGSVDEHLSGPCWADAGCESAWRCVMCRNVSAAWCSSKQTLQRGRHGIKLTQKHNSRLELACIHSHWAAAPRQTYPKALEARTVVWHICLLWLKKSFCSACASWLPTRAEVGQ